MKIEIQDVLKKQDKGYLPSFLVVANLPFRKPDTVVYTRQYNNIKLTLQGQIPYGKYARVLLSFITTNCVLNHKTDDLVISTNSITDLCLALNLPKQRSKAVLEQLDNFANTTMIYNGRFALEKGECFEVRQIPFISALRFIKENKVKTNNMKSFNNNIKNIEFDIRREFIEYANMHAVPVSYSVFTDIDSSLGKDIYAWLCYRNNGLSKENALFLSKEKLVEQFYPIGKDVKDKKMLERINFYEIEKCLREIKEKYYKDLNIEIPKDNSGVYFKKSILPILSKEDEKYMIASDTLGDNFERV